MSSLTYWEKRKAREMHRYMQSAEDAADEISSLYLKSSRYLSADMDKIFERFRKKHRLSESEARRLINTLHDKTSISSLKAALNTAGGDKTKAHILAELESPAFQARLERLQQLQNQIDLTMRNVYGQEKVRNTSHYVDLANEAYYRSVFDIQQRAGVGFSFAAIDSTAIDQVIHSRWSGANYSERIWRNTKALAQDVKQELLISLLTGKTDREVADIIANKYAQGASVARRLIRTESCNLANQMEMASYQECGIEKYIFVATLDLRTSVECRRLDGKRFKVSEQQPGKNCPPMHPWCRSTTICNISDEELAQMRRRARDPVTGKTELVPASMTYEDWHEKNVKGNARAEIKEIMQRNERADRLQHTIYKAIYGKTLPDSFAEFQDMKYNNVNRWRSLKAGKQDKLNQMDFREMDALRGKLGNRETRLWYKSKDERIPDMVDKSMPLEAQAKQAFYLRNEHRTQARELMADKKAREELDRKHKNPTFEEIMEHKKKKYGLTDDEAYNDIIRSSVTTNKQYDRIAGVGREG